MVVMETCRVEGEAWSSWSWLLFLPGSILGGYLGGTMRGGGGGDSGGGGGGGGGGGLMMGKGYW